MTDEEVFFWQAKDLADLRAELDARRAVNGPGHSCEMLAARLVQVERERDALAKFKAFVHQRLDEAGVPTHPDGPHSKAGCRIGDRLDIVLDRADW